LSAVVDAAVAILIRPGGEVLLAQRPAGKVYSGWWEFPGGKIEAGEAPAHALTRELHEELGVEAEQAFPWITRVYAYEHATVRLHFFRVFGWRGEPHGREGQAFSWQRLGAISVGPILPANGPVLKGLALPMEYALSNAGDVGEDAFLAALERRLGDGLRLVQVREKAMPRERLARLVRRVVDLARPYDAIVLVNGDEEVAREAGAHGLHLPSAALAGRSVRPAFEWVGASVHSGAELRKAEAMGADFAVLGPVQASASHPDATPLGWEAFGRVAADASVPVFALGGLARSDLDRAREHGAHGVAMIRGAWEETEAGKGTGEG
jgi:8-oxo-dGTP diphosphatase